MQIIQNTWKRSVSFVKETGILKNAAASVACFTGLYALFTGVGFISLGIIERVHRLFTKTEETLATIQSTADPVSETPIAKIIAYFVTAFALLGFVFWGVNHYTTDSQEQEN